MSFGKKLRYYRIKTGLTQEKLAEGICHTTYISKIENNNILPPDATLIDLCAKLNITLEQLKQKENEEEWILLDNWAEQIQKKRINDAQIQYVYLTSVFQEVDNPLLLTHYYIILLRYYILIKDKQKSIKIFHKIKGYKSYAKSKIDYKFSLGLYEYHYGDLHVSYNHFLQAEQIVKENSRIKTEILYYIALVLSRLRNISLSTIYLHKALELYSWEVDFERIIDCNLLLGINFNLMNEYHTAEKYFHKVIEAAKFHKKGRISIGKAYHNLGNIYSKQGQSKRAINMLKKSISFKDQIDTMSNTFYLLTREYFKIENIEKGKECLSKGMRLAKMEGVSQYKLKFDILYSQNNSDIDTPRYHFLLEKAVYFFKNTDVDFSCESAELLAEIYAKKFHYKEAYKYLQIANELRRW